MNDNVTKPQILQRAFANKCPNCGSAKLFPPRTLRIHRRCPKCGTGFDRGEGFFLGPLVINYTVAVMLFVVPAVVAGSRGAISWSTALILALIGCTIPPLVLYRASWGWWLALYFCVVPERLPANGGPTGQEEED